MKTSSKIFIGVAAAFLVLCAANAIIAGIQHRKYKPAAEELTAQLDRAGIRIVKFDSTDANDTEYLRYRFSRADSRDGKRQYLNINPAALQTARISGDTLFLSENKNNAGWTIFRSTGLDTVIVRQKGKPDVIMDYTDKETLGDK